MVAPERRSHLRHVPFGLHGPVQSGHHACMILGLGASQEVAAGGIDVDSVAVDKLRRRADRPGSEVISARRGPGARARELSPRMTRRRRPPVPMPVRPSPRSRSRSIRLLQLRLESLFDLATQRGEIGVGGGSRLQGQPVTDRETAGRRGPRADREPRALRGSPVPRAFSSIPRRALKCIGTIAGRD